MAFTIATLIVITTIIDIVVTNFIVMALNIAIVIVIVNTTVIDIVVSFAIVMAINITIVIVITIDIVVTTVFVMPTTIVIVIVITIVIVMAITNVMLITYIVPFADHLLHSFLQRKLLTGCLTDAFKLRQVRLQVHLHHAGQVGVLVRLQRVAQDLRHRFPVTVPKARIEQRLNEREVLLELVHLRLHLVCGKHGFHF